jgi:hypothetical protein
MTADELAKEKAAVKRILGAFDKYVCVCTATWNLIDTQKI